MISTRVRMQTVKLISRLLQPIAETGVITYPELQELKINLQHLAQKGELCPDTPLKLITPQEAAEMLSISYSQFRELEKTNTFTFKRVRIGNKTVRYRNIDVIKYIMSQCNESEDSVIC